MLVVGLGNPGRANKQTRHNIGFRVVKAYARERHIPLRPSRTFKGEFGNQEGVQILLPSTYMNLSGEALKKCVKAYGVPSEEVIVVCDDIYLPFGELRFRKEGGAGGHNGLKSVQAALGTPAYLRIRVGVGSHGEHDLADYVLAPFTRAEEQELPNVIEKAVQKLLAITGT